MSLTTALAQAVAPPAAASPVLTSGASFTYGAWVELITSTATPITIAGLSLSVPSLGGNALVDLQIGVGLAGAEVAISTYFFFLAGGASGPNSFPFEVPLDGITTGTRVAMRLRYQSSAGTIAVALHYYANFDASHKSTLAASYVPLGAAQVATTPGASWASGSWFQLTAGLGSENALLGIEVRGHNSGVGFYDQEIDLGIGGAGAEVLVTTLRGYVAAGGSSGWGGYSLPAPLPVSGSSRIACRSRHSATGTAAIDVSLRFLGPTSLLPVPDPTGGGSPGTGTDPVADTSLCGAKILTLWVELELDASTVRWSRVIQPLAHPSTYHGGPKEPRILALGGITHQLSDWTGHFVTSGTSLTVEDTDGAVRLAINGNTLKNKECNIFVIDDTDGRASLVPHRGGCFVVQDWTLNGDQSVTLALADRLGAKGVSLNLSKQISPVLLDGTTFPNLPAALIGKAAPWPYGILSDEDAPGGPVGVVPVWFVGTRVMADGNPWYEGLIAGCATKGPISLFGSDGTIARVKLDTSYYSTDIAFPGLGQWTTITGGSTIYRVINNRRWTVLYVKVGSAIGEAFRDGTVPLVCNLGGIEDVGDSTGNVITSLPRQAVHQLTNLVLQDPPGDANWLSIPTIGSPAYSIISTSTFEAVKTQSEVRVAGGYLGRYLISWDLNQTSCEDWIARICLGGDFDIYVNRHGQICASMENSAATATKAFIDRPDVVQGSYSTAKDWSKWANKIVWDHMKRYPPSVNTAFLYDGVDWLFAKDINDDGSFQAAQRDVQIFPYEDWVTRDFTLAIPNDVGAHKLARMKRAPDYTTATVDLCGTDLGPGDYFNVTHFAGIVPTIRKCRVYSITADYLAGKTTLVGHDMVDL